MRTNDLNLIKVNVNTNQNSVMEHDDTVQNAAIAPKQEAPTIDDIQDLFTNDTEDNIDRDDTTINDLNLHDQTGSIAIQAQIAAQADISINTNSNGDIANTASTNHMPVDTNNHTFSMDTNINTTSEPSTTVTDNSHNVNNIDINNIFLDDNTNNVQDAPQLSDVTQMNNTINSDFSMPLDNQINPDV